MSSLTQDERKEYMDTLKLFMIEDLDKILYLVGCRKKRRVPHQNPQF
jgi:hypothetical protein